MELKNDPQEMDNLKIYFYIWYFNIPYVFFSRRIDFYYFRSPYATFRNQYY